VDSQKTKIGRRSRFTLGPATGAEGLCALSLPLPIACKGSDTSTVFRRRFLNPAVDAAGLAPLHIHDMRRSAVLQIMRWVGAGGVGVGAGAPELLLTHVQIEEVLNMEPNQRAQRGRPDRPHR
jgi:integrase